MNVEPCKFRLFSPASALFFPGTTVSVTEQEWETEELLKNHQAGITSVCIYMVHYAIRVRRERVISSAVVSRIEINVIDLEIKSKYRRERASGSHESISCFLSERKWWYSCSDMVPSPGDREQGALRRIIHKTHNVPNGSECLSPESSTLTVAHLAALLPYSSYSRDS